MALLVGMLLVIVFGGLVCWVTKKDIDKFTKSEPSDASYVILSASDGVKSAIVKSVIVQGVTAEGKNFYWTCENGKIDVPDMR